MKNYEIGLTAPPFHCWCRTITIPYFDDEFTQDEKRFYRDENGKSGYVENMTYKEWKEKYVTNDNNGGIIKEQPKKTIKSAKTFKVQQNTKTNYKEKTVEQRYKELKNKDFMSLSSEEKKIVTNYRLYEFEEDNKYLEEAKLYNSKIEEKLKPRETNYFDSNFERKFTKAKQYTTEQSDNLTKLYKNRLDELNTNQKSSIADYTGMDFDDINRSLRTAGKVNERLSKNIDNITDVLNNSLLLTN